MRIDKIEAVYLKGVAIIMMFVHHLFAFPERIIEPASYTRLVHSLEIEWYLGSVCKACVPMFLFLSGYGFSKVGKKPKSYYLSKVLSFFQVYWFYFIVFIPMGFVFFPDTTLFESEKLRFDYDPFAIAANFFTLSYSFNGEWWFAQTYLLLVLMVPFVHLFKEKLSVLLIISFCFFCTAYIFRVFDVDTPFLSLFLFFYWQVPFVLGYVFSEKQTLWKPWIQIRFLQEILFVALLICSGFLYRYLSVPGLILATPLILFSALQFRKHTRFLNRIFEYLGAYSLPMWLTHSFFCYYYWQDVVYQFKYSPLVLLTLVLLTFSTVFILEKVRLHIQMNFKNFFVRTARQDEN